MIITLNSLLDRLLTSTSFSFLRFNFVLSFGTYSSISLFCQIICVYFYVLGRLVTFPDLGEMALCRRCPVKPSSTLPSGHQMYDLGVPPMWTVWAHPLQQVQLLWVHCRQGWPLAWLAARFCPLLWPQASWWVGPFPSAAGCGAQEILGLCWPTIWCGQVCGQLPMGARDPLAGAGPPMSRVGSWSPAVGPRLSLGLVLTCW